MSNRFRLDKTDSFSILKGAILALSSASATYALTKISTISDDATKLFLAAVIAIVLNTIRKFCSKG